MPDGQAQIPVSSRNLKVPKHSKQRPVMLSHDKQFAGHDWMLTSISVDSELSSTVGNSTTKSKLNSLHEEPSVQLSQFSGHLRHYD